MADIITIISVSFVSKVSQEQESKFLLTNIEVSNWHITFIWLIAFITYLGFLKIYWEKNIDVDGLDNEFAIFIVSER